MAEIQRNILKQGKRNAISRHFHKKSDSEAIAAWRSDFNRILHVFSVRSSTFVGLLLTFPYQTELEVNARVTDVGVSHDVANTDIMASDVHCDISDANNSVSDTHHNALKSREEIGVQGTVVSTSFTMAVTE